jgi:hypothetical protein
MATMWLNDVSRAQNTFPIALRPKEAGIAQGASRVPAMTPISRGL